MNKLQIASPAFSHDGMIPSKFTCDGADVSPPLSIVDIPEKTGSLALIVDDPDAPDPAAPRMTWVHWVLYNLPPGATVLAEGVAVKDLPPGTRQGLNDWQRTGYGGPCPPSGAHHYRFNLYALDTELKLHPKSSKQDLIFAMEGRILAQSELLGLYTRE